ncbi:integrase, partial [Beijerinckia mobilis]|uniref:integrase n=1 Tax=Beijerinckia mobilis TaxID=231434 RepID=UPI00147071CA
VLDDEKERKRVVASCHDELAHKGREATYHLVKTRYYWEGMYEAVKHHVRTCPNCQFRAPDRQYEAFQPNKVMRLWEVVFIDTTHMPAEDGYGVIIQARDGLSGWVEARPLKITSATCQAVCQFLWEDIICRFGWPERVVMDSGPEFRNEVRQFMHSKGVRRTAISPYNPGSNGPIERSMRTLKDAISKMTNGYSAANSERLGTNIRVRKKRGIARPSPPSWRECFYAALLADRVTVNSQTGVSPYRLLMGTHATLPIELEVPTWSTLPWDKIETREDLLAMRARQILRRDEDMQEAILRLERMREKNREYFDSKKSLREHPLSVGDMVLLHNTMEQTAYHSDVKLQYRWHGPYRIKAVKRHGSYTLEELDGTPIEGYPRPDGTRDNSYNGKSLKRFWFRKGADEGVERNEDEAEEADEADESYDLGDDE